MSNNENNYLYTVRQSLRGLNTFEWILLGAILTLTIVGFAMKIATTGSISLNVAISAIAAILGVFCVVLGAKGAMANWIFGTIMIFAKTLFVNTNTTPKKTGTITSTEYVPPKTTTTSEEPQETKKSKKATEPDEDPYKGDDDDNDDAVGDIQCISAVYLHPQPTSSSENLLTIPSGATCKYYRNENGWYYVEYNGTKGYAWQTFFSTPPQ